MVRDVSGIKKIENLGGGEQGTTNPMSDPSNHPTPNQPDIPDQPPNPHKKRKGRKIRNEAALIERRRARVARMYAEKGMTMQRIAEKEEISLTTVSKDIAWLREQMKEHYLEDMHGMAATELARLDELYMKLARWADISSKPLGTKAAERGVERPPDMDIISRMIKCIEMKLKVSGLLKDKEVNVNNNTQFNVWEMLQDDELSDQPDMSQALDTIPPSYLPGIPDPVEERMRELGMENDSNTQEE